METNNKIGFWRWLFAKKVAGEINTIVRYDEAENNYCIDGKYLRAEEKRR